MNWTEEQKQAIEENGKNILVSAAAGSGKTAVLVERMINKILNENVDIDKILIVTFTSAAASEMRERILEAIYKKLEEEPENKNLQRQIVLLNKANISTIHAFCLNVIKNNFFEIGMSPDFRIAEPAEVELLKLEVLDDMLEEMYEANDETLIKLTDIYSGYIGDENLKELILQIYNYIQSTPFPDEWLTEQVEKFNMKKNKFAETEWAKIILNNYKEEVNENLKELERIRKTLEVEPDLQKYYTVLSEDIVELNLLIAGNEWNEVYEKSKTFEMKKWPTDKKIVSEIKEEAKNAREPVRKNIKALIASSFSASAEEASEDLQAMYEVLCLLKEVILKFSNALQQAKQSKNIIDFGDFEHYALKILTKKDEEGNIVPSDIAKKYAEKFKEIAIDEYQDSNSVQECILKSISNGKNLFMVGDVKQSIYKFRQARPELFLEKYQTYKLKQKYEAGDSLKILLFNNFRSKEKILKFVNTIFANIMTKNLGEIDYTKEEYLNYKANYESIEQDENIELHIIENNKKETEGKEEEAEEDVANGEENAVEELEKDELEAKFVAKRIKDIINSDYKVWDKHLSVYRKATYKDIVVLLRSPNAIAPIYEKEISALNIPVFSDTSVKYLESIEIETIMNLLKLIDNPMQDIPLVTVLRSYIVGLTDNELIEIRLADKNCPFYEAILKANNPKVDKFLENLKKWQFEQEYIPLDELIWKIYLDTGYFNYVSLMPNGEFRQANLKMLFEQAKQYENASFKGLYNFIKFIEKLKKNNGDLSSAKLIGENDNVVRIMSIHKSKGLEFPIVFLSGTGKKFNFQDLTNDILLHQELGLGPKYINYERKISYNTVAKEAIKIKAKNEIISEEMRVLYVALTRSKEKLIITGVTKKLPQILKKCNTYLDWICYANNATDMNKIVNIQYYQKADLEKDFNTEEKGEAINIEEILKKYKTNKEEMELIEKELNWKYAYMENTLIESKTSVSSITKHEETVKKEYSVPDFMKGEKMPSKAEMGTIVHEILQKIDIGKECTFDEVRDIADKIMVQHCGMDAKNVLSDMQINEIYQFIESDLAKRAKNAIVVYKEQPFYTYVKANEVYDVESDELILVQGIIDLFFVENDGIVLVDYKTDSVKCEQDLVDRYKKQLSFYKVAVEQAMGKNVKEVYIFSTKLNKAILL